MNLLCVMLSSVTVAGGLPDVEGKLEPGTPASVTIAAPESDRTLSIVISLTEPGALVSGPAVTASVVLGSATLHKTLHLGDPDVAWLVHQPNGVEARVALEVAKERKTPLLYKIRVGEVGGPAEGGVAFEAEPNDRFEDANPLTLGQTVYGLADDRPYFPQGESATEAETTTGQDWFTFEFDSDTPKLGFFGLEFVDRDVPPDLRLFQVKEGKLVEYTQGIDPQSLQRERPPRPGANKFTTRVLSKGRYYVLVDACQPEYTLRTKLFDVPPYLSKADAEKATPEAITVAAQKAIRTAMDFQLLAGDSWHANTPRKGHPTDRIANVHHEASTCIACHPTHFTTQSALAAVRSGYKVEQPFALQFLTDRLANNPVPFHGYPDALWARMIPAPANVMGRLSTILIDYENLVTHDPRNNTHKGIAEFLKLYYDGRETIAPDESNGNNPVSRYKVAGDAWRQLDEIARRTGDPRYAETRDLVARLLPMGEPSNTRDLAAQTIGLCAAGKEKFAILIQRNVEQLLTLQHEDGHWPIKFDAKSPSAEMQTGESLYALALAGLPMDHPAIHKGVVALLTRQKPFGGWIDLGPYEQFQTPFRETQWALISLSRLFPGPGAQGWDGPLGPEPKTLVATTPSRLIADLDRVWDEPSRELHDAIVACLDHASPLARYAAARALSRVGRPSSVERLIGRLGDESKVVARAAAEAVRAIGNRINAAAPPDSTEEQKRFSAQLQQALGSPDDRVRRGATRVFAAHFRDLSQESGLAHALIARLDDTDPVVRMQAIKGLWRWWYWRADLELRDKIENALIAGLAAPQHPWVRRNLIESLYIIGDENIRYLYSNWVPALATKDRRDRATTAQHATTNRLGEKYAAALDAGDRLQREGILRAMSEFHERPVMGGRIGNDLEPMLFYDDALPRISAALSRQMNDPAPTIRRLALQALVTLRGYRDPLLALAVLVRQGDPDPEVREWAGTMTKEFPLRTGGGAAEPTLLNALDALLENPVPEAQASALAVVAKLGPGAVARAEAVRTRLDAAEPKVRAAALRAVAALPALLDEEPVKAAIARALDDEDVEAYVAAVRLVLGKKGLVSEGTLRKALEDPPAAHRVGLLAAVAESKTYADDLRLVGVVSNSLVEDDKGVREKALQVIQTHPALVANPAVEESLRELTRSDNPRQKEMATALLKSRGRSSGTDAVADRLDLPFFEAKVLPIFNTPGEDGQSCVGCHRSHTILKLLPPGKDGTWAPQTVRADFRAALRVVNLADPAASLILGKPTWEAAEEAEAQNDPTKKAHAGGIRFETKTSSEYQTILDWINGARIGAAARADP